MPKKKKSAQDRATTVEELEKIRDEKRGDLQKIEKLRIEIDHIEDDQVQELESYWAKLSGWTLSAEALDSLKSLVRRFSMIEIFEAMGIAEKLYFRGTCAKSIQNGWEKLGGICHNRRMTGESRSGERVCQG